MSCVQNQGPAVVAPCYGEAMNACLLAPLVYAMILPPAATQPPPAESPAPAIKKIYIAPMPQALHHWLKSKLRKAGLLEVAHRQEDADVILIAASPLEAESFLVRGDQGLAVNEQELRRRLLHGSYWKNELVFQLFHRRQGKELWKTELVVPLLEYDPDQIAKKVLEGFKKAYESGFAPPETTDR